MHLSRYYNRVRDILDSNRSLAVEELTFAEVDRGRAGVLKGRVRLWDDSIFIFKETYVTRGVSLAKVSYA